MAKAKNFLPYPKVHYRDNNPKIEQALFEKAQELIGGNKSLNFILLSGQFYDIKSWTYSAIRGWKGAIKPGSSSRKSLLDATFACMSVYLSSIISFQSDFTYAYEEIKTILEENDRDDLWTIIEEKLPFISLPPAEMFPEGLHSPIAPYFTIKQDESLFLGELYPSVFLSNYIKDMKSRFIIFFNYEGYNAFGFFNQLPEAANFGFNTEPEEFTGPPTTENIVEKISKCNNLKELLVIFMYCHNNTLLEQYLIPDYETFLNKLLDIEDVAGEDLIA